jgi:hypothetical protein
MWEDILKNIQISSQRATSRNIVAPDEDEDVPDEEQNDEDCKKWWKDLMEMCNKLLDYVAGGPNKTAGYFYNTDYMDNEVLCKARESIFEGYATMSTSYHFNSEKVKYKDFDIYDPDSDTFLTVRYESVNEERPVLAILMNIDEGNKSRYVYEKSVPIMRDHNSISIISQSVVDDIGNHIKHIERFHHFILDISGYYKKWGEEEDALEKSAIQIGSQKTMSRDLVSPDEDDEDCYQWWLELMSYLNQMISGLDRNATLLQTNEIYSLPPDLVCFYKDTLLNTDPYYYQSQYYKGFIRNSIKPPVVFAAYCRTDYSGYGEPTFYATITLGDKDIFKHQVKLLNDTFLRDLKTYNTYSKGMVYDFVKKFQDAELKVKRHTEDNSDKSITQYIIEVYDDYFREEFDISKNISIGSQKTTTRRLVGPDDDKSCREELNELIERILNYKTDLFRGPPTRSGAYFKSWVVNTEGYTYESRVRETNSLFLEAHFTRELDEETCCAILAAIDKYKSQDEVETEIPIPSADGYDKGVLVLSKEISETRMYYHLFMASGKYLAMTISINMQRDAGIPDEEWDKVKRIFESR